MEMQRDKPDLLAGCRLFAGALQIVFRLFPDLRPSQPDLRPSQPDPPPLSPGPLPLPTRPLPHSLPPFPLHCLDAQGYIITSLTWVGRGSGANLYPHYLA